MADGLSDAIHAQYVHRTLDGPKPPANPIARLLGFQEAPEPAPSPKLAKANQALQRRRARTKWTRLLHALNHHTEPRRA